MPKFSDYYDKKSIEHTLDKLFYEASSTRTGKTLGVVNFEVFSAKAGARTRQPGKERFILFRRKLTAVKREKFAKNSWNYFKWKVVTFTVQSLIL